ncbi:MAG: metallophosphoesterase [Planctomycetota bacterium]
MYAFLLLIAFVGHCVLWVSIVNRVHGVGFQRWIVDAVTHFCMVDFAVIPLAVLVATSLHNSSSTAAAFTSTPSGWYVLLCLFVSCWALVWTVFVKRHRERHGVVQSESTCVLDLHAKHGDELLAPGTVRRLVRLPGNQVLRPVLAEKELLIPRLPAPLDGLRIAHLTDLHMSGRIGIAYFRDLIEATLDAQPDLIALTGDLVEYDAQHAWVDETLLKLTAPEGVFFVLGNHDLKHDNTKLRQELSKGGLIDLGGTSDQRDIRGQRVRLVGNELPWFAPAGDPQGNGEPVDFTVALAHGPDQFRWAEQHGIDLLLAGHNHGGQIRLPLLGAVVTPSVHGTRYSGGTFRRGDTVMHVCRGIGSLAPLRFNCPPELAILTLRSERT